MSRYQRVLSRWLLPTLVVGGVVAMHVLAGGSHSGHASTGLSPSAAADSGSAMGRSHGGAVTDEVDHGETSVPHVAHRSAADLSARASLQLPQSALPASDSMPPMAMCLAVLFTAVLLLALPRLRSVTGLRLAAPSLPWRRTARPSRAPPRDLLAQICVLRT